MAKKKTQEKTIESEITTVDWDKLASGVDMELLDDIEPVSYFIDTGVLAVNAIISGRFIGGGVPAGRITEIYGDSATGKSLLGTNVLRGAQTLGGVPILLDAERAVSKEFAKKASKIDPRRLFIVSADTLEGCFNKIYTNIRDLRAQIGPKPPIVIVYDSIAASPSEKEFAETTVDMENASDAEKKRAGVGDGLGARARTSSKEFRKLPNFLSENNATLIVINQIREKIGVMFGDPRTTAGGGRALEYYASVRLSMRARKVPKDAKGSVLGVNVAITNTKNRCFRPFVEADSIYLMFESGINPFGGILRLLLQMDRVEAAGSAGWYKIKEPYAGGKEIKFRSTLDRNDVPLETLLECPAVIDADNKEQILYYANLYKSAIDAVNNDISKEDVCDQDI